MASVEQERREVEAYRSDMQQDGGRFAAVKAYDGICTLLLAILIELREAREEARSS